MNYYRMHIGDYLRDTAHLTLLEHGIYTRLLHVYYTRESAIPDGQAARLIGARSKEDRAALNRVLAEFFQLVDGSWRQARCDREIVVTQEKAERNREVGKQGGRPRKAVTQKEPTANPDGFHPEHPPDNPDGFFYEPTDNPFPVASSQEKAIAPSVLVIDAENPASPDPPQPNGKRSLPNCPAERIVDLYHEVLPELPKVQILNGPRRQAMRRRWLEWAAEEHWETERDGLERWRELFTHVRKSDFLMGKKKPIPPNRLFFADLDFIMNPSKHALIVEGKYHEK